MYIFYTEKNGLGRKKECGVGMVVLIIGNELEQVKEIRTNIFCAYLLQFVSVRTPFTALAR